MPAADSPEYTAAMTALEDAPPDGSRWRHRKTGTVYRVVTSGLAEADLTPVVCYRRAGGGGPLWVRVLTEFADGRFEPAAS